MSDNYFLTEKSEFGTKIIVTSNWHDSIADYMLEHNIKELELNYAKGWKGKDLSFLLSLPNIEALTLVKWTLKDISPINSLKSLKSLDVSTYCKTKIEFDNFPFLETCALNWRAKAKSIFSCKTLKSLYIDHYSGKDLSQFKDLTKLESLSFSNAPIRNISDISHLKKLSSLGLYNLRKLESLSGIERLESLETLEISGCNTLNEISAVSNLSNLKQLHIGDNRDINSLSPIKNLDNLESVLFYGKTNIVDGDLSHLLHLNKLEKIAFQERAHYSHTRQDFGTRAL